MGDDAERTEPPDELSEPSIGRYLAAQRRLRGISLDELAERTKIPRRNLERLESGAFDDQADGFVRGFVRTVASELGLDPREAVLRIVGEPLASDEEWLRGRRLVLGLVAAGLAGGLLIALGWGLRRTARWLSAPTGAPTAEYVYRRDVVRELAEETEAASESTAPDAAAEP